MIRLFVTTQNGLFFLLAGKVIYIGNGRNFWRVNGEVGHTNQLQCTFGCVQ